jgi:formylglycine-generating enzyme required for sulfatase activity
MTVTVEAYSGSTLKYAGTAHDVSAKAGERTIVEVILLRKGQQGETETFALLGGATIKMVWIEPGTFLMGSPQEEIDQLNAEHSTDLYSYEGPQHEVTITKGFWLGTYELTQRQWERVMETTPWSENGYEKFFVQENPRHPAVYISWNDMQWFIETLNEAEGSEVYRLPTEAEWEYACRAETETRWSFGDDESQLTNYAWYEDNAKNEGEDYGHAVGAKVPNPWGSYDMYGNVWEWCQDWYGSYPSSFQTDPTGPATGSFRVLRGGSFGDAARNTRSASRYSLSPDDRYGGIGARLLRQGP